MCCEQSTGLSKGRESYGDGASIVVRRVNDEQKCPEMDED